MTSTRPGSTRSPPSMPIGPDITPDLAQKGLVADARNMLTNVAHGETLSPGKRQLLLTSIIASATPAELHEARISAQLLKYAQGKRLSKEDMEELAPFLPSESAAYSKAITKDAYKLPYKDYVETYKKQIRTIKWWVEQGKKAEGGPDLPPLDAPAEMPIWWKRRMKQCCPQSVVDAARGAVGPGPASSPPPQPAKPSSAPSQSAGSTPPPAPVLRFENVAVSTQEQSLQHLKEQLARARHDLLSEQAMEVPDQAKIETKERKWRELRNEVDKAEESVFKMRSKLGKLVDLEELGAELLPMLVTVAESFRSLLTRLKPSLTAATTDEERDVIWQAGVDECFTELIASGFVCRETLALAA